MARDYVLTGEDTHGGTAGTCSRAGVASVKRSERSFPSGFEKFIKAFIVIAVLFLSGELVWLFGITPFRAFSKIDISGPASLSREEILKKAGITSSSSYFSTNIVSAEKGLEAFSALESVKVIKHFPDKLQIVLESRRAVAFALASANGRIVPVLFDSHGVIFQVGGAERDGSLPGHLPVISGLLIDDPFPGLRLPAFFIPLFRELEKINAASPELLSAVSELRIIPKPFNSYDVVLYPVHRKVKVRLSELNEDLLRYTLLMVDVVTAKDPGIDFLDFRSGIASYILKEASSE
jgi:cell division protein FtsQ